MPDTVIKGEGGLPKIALTIPDGSTAEVYLHGAHVTSWKPAGGEEVLFLSRASEFRSGKAIRGGIPVIFPQFAAFGPLPRHGFARTSMWELVSITSERADQANARLALRPDNSLAEIWPYQFALEVTVSLKPGSLDVTLAVENMDAHPWSFTAALHSYFRAADIHKTVVRGLSGVEYIDQANGDLRKTENMPEIWLSSEVDRIYMDAPRHVEIIDPSRHILVSSENFYDWVVWNPGAEKARALKDLEPEEYLRFVCVEAAAASRPVTLNPSETWQGTTRFRLPPAGEPGHR